MKMVFFILLLANTLFSGTIKVYLYSPEININNFKSLKMSFDAYLGRYGNYELQPFNDKETFEKYLQQKNSVAILSSWHYRKIAKKYNLEAMLVAQKKGDTTDRKLLIGQKNIPLKGVLASAYDKEYTHELLHSLTNSNSKELSVLKVSNELDALIGVSFGMSNFALVSKDTFIYLQNTNPLLAKDLKIYFESKPDYRMILACDKMDKENNILVSIFKEIGMTNNGANILNMLGIDRLVVFDVQNLENSRDLK